MAKDPSFLFYSKDWLEGTAEMLPEEKGVYIDLLCHQHQKGNLPSDTVRLARLTGLSHEEFLKIWAGIACKFIPDGNRIANAKLTDVVTERKANAWQNTIISNWAVIIRAAEIPADVKEKIKKQFKVKDFLTETPETITERLNKWFTVRLNEWLPFLEDANAIENANTIKKGGTGENNTPAPVFGIGLTDIDLLKEKVLLDAEFKRVFVQRGLPSEKIEPWLKNFNAFLRHGGTQRKTEKDYRFHFGNWLKEQDVEHPENYSPIQNLNNGRTKSISKNFTRQPAGAVSGTGGY